MSDICLSKPKSTGTERANEIASQILANLAPENPTHPLEAKTEQRTKPIKVFNMTLPNPVKLSTIWEETTPLAPQIISGVLRQGHKMMFTAPSKAGKSFALMELAAAVATGKEWLGFECKKGSVLYVN